MASSNRRIRSIDRYMSVGRPWPSWRAAWSRAGAAAALIGGVAGLDPSFVVILLWRILPVFRLAPDLLKLRGCRPEIFGLLLLGRGLGAGCDRPLEDSNQLIGPLPGAEAGEPLDRPLQVVGGGADRGDHFADGRMVGGSPAFLGGEQILVQPLTGAQSGRHDLDIDARPQPARSDEVVGQVHDANRLPHVQHVQVLGAAETEGADDERRRLAN